MEQLAIIADNLTGASDAGVQFRKFGYSTQVMLDYELVSPCTGIDVLSVNTDSRKVPPDVAYERVYRVAEELTELGFKRFYKKIDSTLRGNIAEEVKAMMQSLALPFAIVVPSYPAHGRIVENGYLQIVQAWGDSSSPLPVCYVPSIIKTAPEIPVAVLTLADVRQGEKELTQKFTELYEAGISLIAVDAIADEDLRMIAIAMERLTVPCLAVGSAGLAGNLPIAWKVVAQEHLNLRQGTMVVAGTLIHVTAEQIISTLDYPNTELIEIQTEDIYDGRDNEEFQRVKSKIETALSAGRIPVVVTDTLLKNRNEAGALSLSVQVQKYGQLVTNFLGKITKDIIEKQGLRNLVISGGSTTTSICHTLGITAIDLERELLPGIPVGKMIGSNCDGVHLVTKAGGFGKRNSLRKVLELL
ncbi:four-carbon acid sugar kinase family protein [Sporomusa acidovorans]|uniref:D-threonate kinase n=1 Tax=Sporomusa acidovorans (strain ATCC 49682 / DSM 3132 / Mol) TaxID=1123286 RepID=A0ABZ3IXG1_SPOA4|nr:four-carbon acid sugar kinase family protein [Sporomusa acidovorans]OZC22368.1 hypothetical protein SPACI_14170 [Sporomusa acidovorans DSM 3132]SDE46998.1 Uncharacterized conserved protein YgbK, DUF1537 family [Sporomusa acidovorans]